MRKILTKYEIYVSYGSKTSVAVDIQQNEDGTIHLDHSKWSMTPRETVIYLSNLSKKIKKEFNV